MKKVFDRLKYKSYVVFGGILKVVFHIVAPAKLNPDKEVSEMKLVMFCGRAGAKLLKPVLISIYKRWKKVPKVVIVTDGTDPEFVRQYMKFWPYPFTIKTWKDQAAYFSKQNKDGLAQYAQNDIWGKKLVSILAEAEAGPTLYCDTDVLWFDEPRLPDSKVGMRMASDDLHCYSDPMIKFFSKEKLLARGPLNAGVLYVNGSMYEKYPGFDKVVEFLRDRYDNRTEQTTFAMLADATGDSWSLDDIILTTEDRYWPFIPSYYKSTRHFARHHVMTKKWWFWRDAIYVVLKNK